MGAIDDLLKIKEDEISDLRKELAAARRVVEASRAIRANYPGGKMLWFSEFDAFEKALAAYDALGKEEK